MSKAMIFFAEGLEEIEGLTVVDLLRRVDIPIKMVSMTGDLMVNGAHGIRIETDVLFEEADFSDTEIFILPGGMPGTKNLRTHKELCELLVKANLAGKFIAAICAAPSVLGELELLKGKRATCYPGFEDKLIGAETCTDPCVRDQNAITSRGMGTAIDFAAEIVALFNGREAADALTKSIIYN